MTSDTVKIINHQGMHMRTANMIVEAAKPFESKVTLTFKGKDIPANTPILIMAAGMKFGDEVGIKAEGPDETEALAAVKKLFLDSFCE
jgi:phosphocarrier protein